MAKNNVRVGLGLDIDLTAGRVDINQRLLQQAIAASLKTLSVPPQEIKQKLNVLPEFNPGELRAAVKRQRAQLDKIIGDEEGLRKQVGRKRGIDPDRLTGVDERKFDESVTALRNQAIRARRELDNIFGLLSPQRGADAALRSPSTQALIKKVTSENFNLDQLRQLTDAQLLKLRNAAARQAQIDAQLRQLINKASRLGQGGLASTTATNLIDPRFIEGATVAADEARRASRAITDAIDPQKIASRQRAVERAARQNERLLLDQQKLAAGQRLVAQGALTGFANIDSLGEARLAKRALRDREDRLQGLLSRGEDPKRVTGATDPERIRRLKEALAETGQVSSTLSKRLKELRRDTDGVTAATRKLADEQARLARGRSLVRQDRVTGAGFANATDADQAREFLRRQVQLADTRVARGEQRGLGAERMNALKASAERARQELARATVQVNAFAKANRAAASDTDRLDASMKRLRQRLAAGQKLAREGAPIGFTNLRSQAEAELARDALQNRQNRLQGALAQGISQGTDPKRIRNITQAMAENDKALQSLTHRFNEYNKVQFQASALIRQFFRYAIGYGALYQMLAAVTALVRGLVSLDEELTSIRAVAQTTKQELLEIESAIKNIALSTRFTTSEIAKAALVLAQAGVPSDKIRETLTATADFAAATGSALETSADLASTFRDVFRELDGIQIADKLTKAINLSKLTANDLKSILSISAQIAESFNLSADQYLAAVTTLRNAGLKATTVATGLRQGLVEIFNPDTKTLKALKRRYREIGEELTGEAIRTRFLAFQTDDSPLLSALRELQRIDFLDSRAGQRAFDIRAENAIKALIRSIDDLARDEAQLSVAGSSLIGSQIQLESFANSLRNLGAAITVFADSVVGDVIPKLRELTTSITEFLEDLTKFNDNLKAQVGSGIGKGLLAGLVAGTTTLFNAKGTLVQKGIKGAAAAAATTGTVTGAFSAAGAADSPRTASVINALLNTALLGSVVATVINVMRGRTTGGTSFGRAVDVARERRATSLGGAASTARRPRQSDLFDSDERARRGGKGGLRTAGEVGFVVGGVASLIELVLAIGDKVKKIPFFDKIAKFGVRFAGPIGAVISGVTALLFLLDEIGNKNEKDLKRLNQRFQNMRGNTSDVQALRAQAEGTRVKPGQVQAPEGTSARLVEELQADLDQINSQIGLVLGDASDDVKQVLLRLASSGAVVDSQERKAVLEDLVELLEGDSKAAVEGLIANWKDLTRDQAALDKSLSDVAVAYSDLSSKAQGLQESFFEQIQQIEELGDPELVQVALKDSFRKLLSEGNFSTLTGEIESLPDTLIPLFVEFMTQATEAIDKALLEQAPEGLDEVDAAAKKAAQEFARELTTDTQLLDQKTQLITSYKELGLSAVEAMDRVLEVFREAKRELDEEGVEREMSPAAREMFLRRGIPIPQVEGGPRDPVAVVAPGIDQDKQALSEAAREAQKKAEAQVKQLLLDLDTGTGQAIFARLNPELQALVATIRGMQERGDSFVDETGKIITELARLQNTINTVRTSLSPVEMLDAEREFAQKEAKEQLDITAPKAEAERRLAQVERDLQEARLEDLDEARRLAQERLELQRHLLDLEHRELVRRAKVIEENTDLDKVAAALEPIEVAKGELARRRKALEEQQRDEAREFREDLDRQELSESLRIREARTQNLPTGPGASIEDPFERGQFLGAGLTPSVQRELDDLGASADKLFSQLADLRGRKAEIEAQEITSDQERQQLLQLEGQINQVNEQLGVLRHHYDELNHTAFEELKQGFDFGQLATELDRVNGGTAQFGENIRSAIVGNLSTLGSQLNEAIRQGENLGDVFRRVFADIADRIADLAADRLFNELFSGAFDKLSGGKRNPEDLKVDTAQRASDAVGQKVGEVITGTVPDKPDLGVTDLLGGVTAANPLPVRVVNGPLDGLLGGGGAGAGGGGGVAPGLDDLLVDTTQRASGIEGVEPDSSTGGGFLGSITGAFKTGVGFFKDAFEGLTESFRNLFGSFIGALKGGVRKIQGYKFDFVGAAVDLVGGYFGAKAGGMAGASADLDVLMQDKELFAEGGVVKDRGEGGVIKGPGSGTSDSIPGVILDKNGKVRSRLAVSDGESILNAKATSALGEDFINELNAGKILKFATGGLIKIGKEATGNSRPSTSQQPQQKTDTHFGREVDPMRLTIVNLNDRKEFEDFMNSPSGDKVLINRMRKNAPVINQALGRGR